jgi:hypothetical protein
LDTKFHNLDEGRPKDKPPPVTLSRAQFFNYKAWSLKVARCRWLGIMASIQMVSGGLSHSNELSSRWIEPISFLAGQVSGIAGC